MRHQFLMVMGALGALVVVSLAPVLIGQAQTTAAAARTLARTSWGDPDLEGVWTGSTPTPLERPLTGARIIQTDAEAEQLEQEIARRFDSPEKRAAEVAIGDSGAYNAFWQDRGRAVKGRASLIVDPPDGRLPPVTPEALARKGGRPGRDPEIGPAGPADNPEDRNAGERCLHWERFINGIVNQHYRIVQVPGYVAINMERLHDNRIIHLDGHQHLPPDVRQWNGDSRGRWEGATLVVDTTNFTDKGEDRVGASKNLHVVERFTRVDANTINYEATLDDPTTWTKPWTLALPLTKEPEGSIGIFEYACHEGNYGMVGMLNGARAKEKATQKGDSRSPR